MTQISTAEVSDLSSIPQFKKGTTNAESPESKLYQSQSALYTTALLYGLDTTIAADVQSAVIEAFEDITQLAWLGAGFALGSVAVILPYGALYSKFSLKYLYIGGITVFELGSVLCGVAPSMSALIVGRVIAGMDGMGMSTGGQGFSDEQIRAVIAGAQSALFEQLNDNMKLNVILAIMGGMQAPFILVIMAGAVIMVSTAAIKREKLFGEIVVVG
ncbi:uncharacterized protein TRIVIDRAFT_67317 [Trichoderma virens Gv29-8]|uniref:Major facilitator superfamily (MFS) profile domain-containing protein n=1 Tax=Hypocrea virens (strain Gv29-8 / FGSC 10586) TaxID=413071 RepID=G9N5R4_HYPVG|nr:uncharacterized protein TRIVIDRAFT_67317 [Trichoderma virens Gv29-8]EHK18106.1 hypothetical protein TRIVIDRAFT_67317 [Trichoderma virens Gv29-8]UKZ54024.1 hypothetical protein TrVGV298_007828 [Trichoderma virens]